MPNGKLWTDEEDAHIEKFAGIHSIPRMAKVLGRSPSAVKSRLFRMGNPAREASGYMTAREVALMYDCPEKRVRTFIQRGILPARKFQGKHKRWLILPEDAEKIEKHLRQKRRLRQGLIRASGKLTEAMVLEMKKRHPRSSYAQLGREFCVSRQTVYRAVKGYSFPHLKEKAWYER